MIAGDLDAAVAYGREAIPLLTALGDRWTAASSMANVGGAIAFHGVTGEPRGACTCGYRDLEEIGSRERRGVRPPVSIGFFMHPFGSFERALSEAEIGLQIAREIGPQRMEGPRPGCGRTDSPEPAEISPVPGDCTRRCSASHGELGANIWLAAALCELGQDLALAGDEPGARALLDEAMVAGGDALEYTAMVMLAQAELPLRYGRPDEALANARRLLAEAPQFRVLAADAASIEGIALAALGKVEEAETTLRRAKAVTVQLGTDPSRWRACLALGDLFLQIDRPDEADAEFAEALALLEAMAGTLSDVHLRRAFEDSEPMRRARQISTLN